MKQDDLWRKAGLELRAMRKSLGYSYLAADEIIRTMRALRETLPKASSPGKSLPKPDGESD